MRLYRHDEHVEMPWRNGAGTTLEVLREPAEGPVFDLRLSFARVEQDGPFSAFDGYDRTIMLVSGRLLTLRVGEPGPEVVHELRAHEPFAFPGEATVHSEVSGPSVDFNVMTRRGVLRADVQVRKLAPGDGPQRLEPTPGARLLFVVLDGTAQAQEGDAGTWLEPLDAAEPTGPVELSSAGGAVLALVHVAG